MWSGAIPQRKKRRIYRSLVRTFAVARFSMCVRVRSEIELVKSTSHMPRMKLLHRIDVQ